MPPRLGAGGGRTAVVEHRRTLLEELQAVVAAAGWELDVREGAFLTGEIAGPLGRWALEVRPSETTDLVLVSTALPRPVPAARRSAVACVLVAINDTLGLGSFGMDPMTGMVRLKVYLVVDTRPVGRAVVERLIRSSGRLLERYVPEIEAAASDREDAGRIAG